jgi:hypothetical protein
MCLSDSRSIVDKAIDGRLFWGCAQMALALSAPCKRIFVEQPLTLAEEALSWPASQRVQPFELGDNVQKSCLLWFIGSDSIPPAPASQHGRPGREWHDTPIADPAVRDLVRSSWAFLPNLAHAVALCPPSSAPPPPVTYSHLIEK